MTVSPGQEGEYRIFDVLVGGYELQVERAPKPAEKFMNELTTPSHL